MKKLLLTAMIMSLLTFGAMNSEEPVQVKAETTITDTEYNNSFHLAQMNVSKKLMETYDGSGVTIAIIDTGVNFDHEEFKDSLGNTIFSELSGVVTGVNTVKNRASYTTEAAWASALNDTAGHGTHVTGLIAAQPNGKGIVGIAPKANIIFIKAVDANNAFPNAYIQTALTYAANNGADIISMSIQSYANSVTYNGSTMTGVAAQTTAFNTYTSADYNLGCTLLAAAGNYNTSEPSYPANSTNVISVGSVSKDDKTAKAPFSNYGTDNIDVVAPGYVMSTYKGSTDTYKSDWYGTSFSTPLTAGLLALYKQANPNATNKSMTEALYASCDSITNSSTYPGWAGNGMINGDRLLNISNATSLSLSAPSYPSVYAGSETLSLSLADLGWKFDLQIDAVPSDTIVPKTHYVSSSNPNAIKLSGNKLEVVGSGSSKIRVESVDDSSIYGEITLTVEDKDDRSTRPITITTDSNLTAEAMGTFEKKSQGSDYALWNKSSATYTWVCDNDTYLAVGNDGTYLASEYNTTGIKVYLVGSVYNTTTYQMEYAITSKIFNITGGQDVANGFNIPAVIAKFAEKRTDPTDLSAIKTSIDEMDTFIKNNASTAPELNKYEYVTPIHRAYNFLADTWYKSVRIKTTSSAAKAVRRANNVDLSICDTVSNETKAKAIVDTYNGLDSLTREILNSTYDVTGSDGVDITIGTSMKYIADASSLSINTIENQLSLVTNTSNPLLIAVIICSAVVVVLASVMVFISLKKKKANIVE